MNFVARIFLGMFLAGVLWAEGFSQDALQWRNDAMCGVNSLYVFLTLHDVNVTYESLYHSVGLRDGVHQQTSLLQMIEECKLHGLPCIAIRSSPKELDEIALPAIAHMEVPSAFGVTGHYVVVVEAGDQEVKYVDGTLGSLDSMSIDDFANQWSSYLLVPREADNWLSRVTMLICGCLFGLCLIWIKKCLFQRRDWLEPNMRFSTPLIVVFCCVTNLCSGQTADELLATATEVWEQIPGDSTFLLECAVSTELIGDKETVYNELGVLSQSQRIIVLATDGKRLFYSEKGEEINHAELYQKLSDTLDKGVLQASPTDFKYADVSKVLSTLKPVPFESTFLFDGEFVLEKSPETSTYGSESQETTYVYHNWRFIEHLLIRPNPIDWIGIPPRMDAYSFDAQYRSLMKVTDIFERDDLTISLVEHSPNVIKISFHQGNAIFLDENLNYAVVRREHFMNDHLASRIELSGHSKRGPFQIPSRIVVENYVQPELSDVLAEHPYQRVTFEIKKILLNDPHALELLAFHPPQGALVIDGRVHPLDESGVEITKVDATDGAIPSVAYRYPADMSQLNSTIEDARTLRKRLNSPHQKQFSLAWKLVFIGVGTVLVIFGMRILNKSFFEVVKS